MTVLEDWIAGNDIVVEDYEVDLSLASNAWRWGDGGVIFLVNQPWNAAAFEFVALSRGEPWAIDKTERKPKKPPQLPCESHNDKPIDPERAMSVTRSMCGG
jgi:hypothetical protein